MSYSGSSGCSRYLEIVLVIDEKVITQVSRDLARILWNLGFRKDSCMDIQLWSEDESNLAFELRNRGLTLKQITHELNARFGHNRTASSVRSRIRNREDAIKHPIAVSQKFELVESEGETAKIVSVSHNIKTAIDACEYGEVDLNIWEICKQRVSSSECSMKMQDGSVKVVPLWHVSVELRRKMPRQVERGIEAFIERLRKHSPSVAKPPRRPKEKEFLFEWSAFDAHFGKRCWGDETGTNYDTSIAERMFSNAVDDMIGEVQDKPIAKVLFPIGQDFFNVDNWNDTTYAGTPQDVDDRFQRVFTAGLMSIVSATEKLAQLAPVDIIWVPGNHDMTTSWYMACALEQRFHSTRHVNVDLSPPSRKYVQWGKTMLMLLHADNEPQRELSSLAATEQPIMWSQTTWREAQCGHLHKKKTMRFTDVDEHHGFITRRLSSLSGTDRWHYRKGYVGGQRCTEGFLFSNEIGLVRHMNCVGRE